MLIRAYTDADFESLRAMHAAQKFSYEFPDVSDPLFLLRAVVEDDGKPRMAALLRLTAEAYLLADPAEGTPRERWQWLYALHETTRQRQGPRLERRASIPAAARGALLRSPSRNARLAARSMELLHQGFVARSSAGFAPVAARF